MTASMTATKNSPAMRRHAAAPRRHTLLAAGACMLAALAAGCSKRSFESIDLTGADYGRDFKLPDADGKVRQLSDFRGRVVLLFFGYTQCPDVCPTALTRAVEAMKLLGADAQRVQVVFVTVDPERDTPVVLREYMRAFHPSFIGLHGNDAQVAAAAKEFKVYYAKVPTPGSYAIDHTAITYAFDPTGRLRLAIKHAQSAASMAGDVQQLLGGA
jgi:protein SCO1/2